MNSTYGLTRLVGLGNKPTPVPLGSVSEMMLRCDREGKLLPPNLLKTGGEVMLSRGPFTDFVATIERIAPDPRVYLIMEFMEAQIRLGGKYGASSTGLKGSLLRWRRCGG